MAPLRLILVVNLIEIKEQMNRHIVLNSNFGLPIKLILENMIYKFPVTKLQNWTVIHPAQASLY